MIIRDQSQEKDYIKAGETSTHILQLMSKQLKVGVLPSDIEKYCWELCKQSNVRPSFYRAPNGHLKYNYSCCISVNEEILHGIPSSSRVFQKGDIVKLDFGIVYKGLYTDQCYTFIVEKASKENEKLVRISKLATETALKFAVSGNTIGDIGEPMYNLALQGGYDILKEYVGHSIGLSLHEEPDIPAYGIAGRGKRLQEGLVICIESQVVAGSDQTYTDENNWTVKTVDGKQTSMFEYMVIVKKDKPLILTPMQDWNIFI